MFEQLNDPKLAGRKSWRERVSGESIPRRVFTLGERKARLLNAPNGREGIRQVDHTTFVYRLNQGTIPKELGVD